LLFNKTVIVTYFCWANMNYYSSQEILVIRARLLILNGLSFLRSYILWGVFFDI
jgi:hypothetical protein